MSNWTYINGTIIVSPMGRTQPEKRYILDTVLNHLPRVSGSEGNMDVYVIQKRGHSGSCSHDEFGQRTNNLEGHDGNKTRNGCLRVQDDYILVVNAALMNVEFDDGFKQFMKWIVRLGKRIGIIDIFVNVEDYYKSTTIKNHQVDSSYKYVFSELFEDPSWCNKDGEPNWCEFMMYDRAKDSDYPMLLAYKYFDEENDTEVERRMNYGKGNK